MTQTESLAEAVEMVNVTISSLNNYYHKAPNVDPIAPIPSHLRQETYGSAETCEAAHDHIDRIQTAVETRHGQVASTLEPPERRVVNRMANTTLTNHLDTYDRLVNNEE